MRYTVSEGWGSKVDSNESHAGCTGVKTPVFRFYKHYNDKVTSVNFPTAHYLFQNGKKITEMCPFQSYVQQALRFSSVRYDNLIAGVRFHWRSYH